MVTRVGRCYGPVSARVVGRSGLGLLVAAVVALAVLVHHDSTATAGPHDMSLIGMAAMAEPGAGHPASAAHASHSGSVGSSAYEDAPSGDADNAMNCGEGVLPHCGVASTETTRLSPPKEAFRAGAVTYPDPSRGPATARSPERSPPGLSVFLQLRI